MKRPLHSAILTYAAGGVLLATLLVGCRSTKKLAPATPPEPAVEAVAPQPRTYTVMTFTGEVEGISVSGQLRLAQDSAMWLSVNKLIEVGRAMCTPDSLWLRAPLLGRDDAMDYATLRQLTGVTVTYDELQQTALADDAEERIARLAQRLGVAATVRITQRRQVERLSFPYPKPIKP